ITANETNQPSQPSRRTQIRSTNEKSVSTATVENGAQNLPVYCSPERGPDQRMVRVQPADTPFVEKEEAREVGLHWASPCTSNALGTVSNHCRGQDTLNPGGKRGKEDCKRCGSAQKRERNRTYASKTQKSAKKRGKTLRERVKYMKKY